MLVILLSVMQCLHIRILQTLLAIKMNVFMIHLENLKVNILSRWNLRKPKLMYKLSWKWLHKCTRLWMIQRSFIALWRQQFLWSLVEFQCGAWDQSIRWTKILLSHHISRTQNCLIVSFWKEWFQLKWKLLVLHRERSLMLNMLLLVQLNH